MSRARIDKILSHEGFGTRKAVKKLLRVSEVTVNGKKVTDTGFIILKNIIRTSKAIGFKTLCEGVETQEQKEAVIKAGCDMLQGFYYYRPMSVAQLEKIFEEE